MRTERFDQIGLLVGVRINAVVSAAQAGEESDGAGTVFIGKNPEVDGGWGTCVVTPQGLPPEGELGVFHRIVIFIRDGSRFGLYSGALCLSVKKAAET